MGKNSIRIFISTRIPKLQSEIFLFLHGNLYPRYSKEYLPIVITLTSTRILSSFNYWRNAKSCSSKSLTLCISGIEVGAFSTWSLEFYCPNKVLIARIRATFTGKAVIMKMSWFEIIDGSNTYFHNFYFWNTDSSIWYFCKFSSYENISRL